MYGLGILKGLSVTLKHFVETYLDDIKWGFGKRYTPEVLKERQSYKARGVFTVQYPEEVLPPQERFRFVPFSGLRRDRRGARVPLHRMRHLRQSLPAAVHLDRQGGGSRDRQAAQETGRVLH